jgi:serine-type D-Ala-D-Ala carboxypeptidase
VHDENAFALGGVAGHAGLFSTAADLAVFAQMMLNGGTYDDVRIVSDSTVAVFTKRAAGTRALGWDTAEGQGGSGDYLTESAYGHTGFTGTSMWIDTEREMFVVLLTNRVHAARARRPAKVIADVRADLADAAALSVEDTEQMLAMPASFRADRADGWNRSVRRSRSSRSKRVTKASSSTRVASKSKKPTTAKSSSARKRSTSKASTSKASAGKASAAKGSTSKASAPKASTSKASASRAKTAAPKSSAKSSSARSKSTTARSAPSKTSSTKAKPTDSKPSG